MPALSAKTIAVADVCSDDRDAMWRVFERYYEGVLRQRFDADLDEKDHVFMMRDPGGVIRGFSTVQVTRHVVAGRQIVSIYSGDTVIEASHHGQTALQVCFFRYIVATKLKNPHRLVVWFLISKGYKTYLLLSRNFVSFYPRRDRQTPPWARQLLTSVAVARFGAAVNHQDPDGVVILRMHGEHGHLRPDVAPVDGQADPDIHFFDQVNPGHPQGDELCCLGVVSARLMVSYPAKLARRALTGGSSKKSASTVFQ